MRVAALPGQPALCMQVKQAGLDLLRRDVLGTAVVVVREPGEGAKTRAYRVLRQAANGQVFESSIMRLRKRVMCLLPWSVNGYGEHRQ